MSKRNLQTLLYKEQDGRCFYCSVKLPSFEQADLQIPKHMERPTVDHVIPKCYGGGLNRHNTVVSCETCNQSKADWIIPGYLWRDREELVKLLRTRECKYGTRRKCCGNDLQFKPWTKQEVIQLWKQISQSSNHNSKIQLLTTT